MLSWHFLVCLFFSDVALVDDLFKLLNLIISFIRGNLSFLVNDGQAIMMEQAEKLEH